jgi:hypothetical protein
MLFEIPPDDTAASDLPISPNLARLAGSVFDLLLAGCAAMSNCPSIFQPRQLRCKAKYRDLSRHLFAAQEIVWLCDEMQGGLHQPWSGQVTSLVAVGRRYRLEVAGLRLWRKLHQEGYAFVEPARCEPADESVLDRYSLRAIGRWQVAAAQGGGTDSDGGATPALRPLGDVLAAEMQKTQARRDYPKWGSPVFR